MKNWFQHYNFLNRALKRKNPHDSEQGFTLLESLAATIILTIAFTLNLQFILALKVKNLEQELQTAAVSVSKEILEDIRFQLRSDIAGYDSSPKNLDENEDGGYDLSRDGYDFNADIFLCTNEPSINDIKVVSNCTSPTSSSDEDIRYVVVQIIDRGRKNETLYTVETVFTTLQFNNNTNQQP